jgi:hypothetical protein
LQFSIPHIAGSFRIETEEFQRSIAILSQRRSPPYGINTRL